MNPFNNAVARDVQGIVSGLDPETLKGPIVNALNIGYLPTSDLAPAIKGPGLDHA